MNVIQVSNPLSLLSWSNVFRVKTASRQPREGVAPNWYGTPCSFRRRCSLLLMNMLITLDVTSSNVIPRQLFGSERSPLFGSGVTVAIFQLSKVRDGLSFGFRHLM